MGELNAMVGLVGTLGGLRRWERQVGGMGEVVSHPGNQGCVGREGRVNEGLTVLFYIFGVGWICG